MPSSRTYAYASLSLKDSDRLLIEEMGLDWGWSATSFVEHFIGKYVTSRSTVWAHLKKLKRLGYLDFHSNEERKFKSLRLTYKGAEEFRNISKDTFTVVPS